MRMKDQYRQRWWRQWIKWMNEWIKWERKREKNTNISWCWSKIKANDRSFYCINWFGVCVCVCIQTVNWNYYQNNNNNNQTIEKENQKWLFPVWMCVTRLKWIIIFFLFLETNRALKYYLIFGQNRKRNRVKKKNQNL